mmetsp:Transcript_16876/g.48012  ORF Transcript_16876/g.48012 Transcript_16876/m.48012 type:complete len:153 (+) Transcript_16876:517-975(+)
MRKKKEIINQWYAENLDNTAPNQVLAKERRGELEAKVRARHEERARKPRTVKTIACEDRVQRTQVAIEERPPLPPKKHDNPSPILDLLEGLVEKSEPATPRRTTPRPAHWTRQAKAVSSTYGLTEKEHLDVEHRLIHGIKGGGRLVSSRNSA